MLTEYLKSPIFISACVALVIAVYIFTQSVMAVGVALALIGVAAYVATLIENPGAITSISLAVAPNPFDSMFGSVASTASPSVQQEVFYVAGDKYNYDDAPSVCAAYNAELATYDQVADAYAKGAEWCGYGWTMGGMALFPTQENTWQKLQQEIDVKKKTKCGRPGVNGGYFDPATKFGVNCFGVKPGCNNKKYPVPLETDASKADAVNKFKQNTGAIKVSPFNRFQWSVWGEGSQ